MKLGEALQSCAEFPGVFCAREVGWKKSDRDATGYGQFVLIMMPKEIFKWVTWNTYEDRFTGGAPLRLGAEYFEKDWEIIPSQELKKAALESLNHLEKENLARYQKEAA